MMSEDLTPGIYVEETSARPGRVEDPAPHGHLQFLAQRLHYFPTRNQFRNAREILVHHSIFVHGGAH